MSRGNDVRCNLPDAIVGIGGAGKKIVFELFKEGTNDRFEHEWLLREAIEPRGDDQLPGTQAYVIDTAKEEQAEDEKHVREINDRVKAYASSEFDVSPGTLTTEVTYLNPLDHTSNKYKSSAGLSRPVTVNEIVDATELNAWWLEQSPHLLNEEENFLSGVNRRRAISKALFHASRTRASPYEAEGLFNITTSSGNPEVSLVVSLGGGTGSGMFIELAKELNQRDIEVDLFAITPGRTEESRYTANAHAALSELEYLSISSENRNPFRGIILLPYAPAKDLHEVDRFQEAVVHTIVGYQNLDPVQQKNKIEQDTHTYAPFTIAAPQTLRFDVGEARILKEQIDDWVESRMQLLDVESELYDAAEEYITTQFDGEEPTAVLQDIRDLTPPPHAEYSILDEDANQLYGRIEELLSFLEMREVDQVGYDTCSYWAEELRTWITEERDELDEEATHGEEYQTIVMKTSSLGHLEANIKPPEEKFKSDPDQQVIEEYIQRELQTIYRRAGLLIVAEAIDDETLSEGVRMILDKEMTNVPGANALRRRQRELNNTVQETKTNLACFAALIDQDNEELDSQHQLAFENDWQRQTEQIKDDWVAQAEPSFEHLVALDSHRDEIETLLEEFASELDNTVVEIEQTDIEVRDTVPLGFDRLDRLNNLLEAAGIDPIPEDDIDSIRRNLQRAAKAKSYWLEAQEGGGILESLTGLIGGSNGDDLQTDYANLRREISNSRFVDINRFDTQFEVDIDTDAIERLFPDPAAERTRLVDELVTDFAEQLDTILMDTNLVLPQQMDELYNGTIDLGQYLPGDTADQQAQLRAELEGEVRVDSLDSLPVIEDAFEAAIIDPIEGVIDELAAELEHYQHQHKRYQRCVQLIEQTSREYADTTVPSSTPEFNIEQTKSQDFTYFKRGEVSDKARFMQEDKDISETTIWEDESAIIRRALDEFVTNSLNPPHMPLRERTLETGGEDGQLYTQHQVVTIFMSRELDTEMGARRRTLQRIEDKFRGKMILPHGNDGYRAKQLGYGDDWDLTQVSFITGVFLDNITDVSKANGYKSTYEQQRESLVEDIRVRHVHGLDGTDKSIAPNQGEAGFVARRDLFDLGNPDEKNLISSGNEERIRDAFLDKISIETFNSTLTIGRDRRPQMEFEPETNPRADE